MLHATSIKDIKMKFKDWKYAALACDIARAKKIKFDLNAVMESDIFGYNIQTNNIFGLCLWNLSGKAGILLRDLSITGVYIITHFPRKQPKPRTLLSELRLISCLISFNWWDRNLWLVVKIAAGIGAAGLIGCLALAGNM